MAALCPEHAPDLARALEILVSIFGDKFRSMNFGPAVKEMRS